MKLNLTATNKQEELILAFLEENASDVLADKINNGTPFEKDGKPLINKKTLSGFMKYACDEARKLAEQGAISACLDSDTVFGLAIHYFEEESIEGTLYTIDGEEYKPAPVAKKTMQKPVNKSIPKTKPQAQLQFSIFDKIEETDVRKPIDDALSVESAEQAVDTDKPSEEDIQDAMRIAAEDEQKKISPIYLKYTEVENQYPNYVVAYRLGDFYEVFGENAKRIANELDLTLTGRDCGLAERIPMIGFPYHVADVYFAKILQFTSIVIIENEKITVKEQAKPTLNVDTDTGEIFDLTEEEMREFDGDIYEPQEPIPDEDTDDLLETAKSIDKELMLRLYTLLDEKMTIA